MEDLKFVSIIDVALNVYLVVVLLFANTTWFVIVARNVVDQVFVNIRSSVHSVLNAMVPLFAFTNVAARIASKAAKPLPTPRPPTTCTLSTASLACAAWKL